MDSFDRKILKALQSNATLSLADLAERVSLSRSACGRRLQSLEAEGYIRNRVALLNAERIGLPLTVFIMIKTDQHNADWARRFKAVVDKLPGVLEVYRMSGATDYLVKAAVKDMPDYDALYQQLIEAELLDVTAGFVMEQMKYTTELPL